MLRHIVNIEGFSKAEYLMAFFAILFGYISSEYFEGFGLVFRYRKNIRFAWSFILFALITFFMLSIYWWDMWARSYQVEFNFLNFLEIMVYPMIYYLLSNILFRDLSHKDLDNLDEYFFNRKTLALSALGAYFLYDLAASYYKTDYIYTSIGLAFCLSGILIKNKTYFRVLLVAGLSLVLIYTFQSFFKPAPPVADGEKAISYTKIEHLTIFVSFIYGFVVAVYLKGWSLLVKDWKSLKYSWGHLIWTLFSFIILISVWWNSWIRSGYMEDQLLYFQLSLLPPLILYLISVVLFPDFKLAETIDLKAHFDKNRKQFYFLFLLYFLLNTGLSLIFKDALFIGWTIPFRLLAIIITVIALFIKNKNFHRALPYFVIIVFLVYLVLNN